MVLRPWHGLEWNHCSREQSPWVRRSGHSRTPPDLFPRHECFRRVLCALVGGWVEAGKAPAVFDALGSMIQDIC